ncbi:Nitrate/nitrite sensor protein narX [Kluyvera cryocrescens]|uniref:Nitrate/nitrite sensor protein narX n=1 Tax=Kluyvera cryocrescens TaxID=580 RepID=A0A485BKU4_KLUCR|nr:Nitrate/nitrite sensor protein narX [Kluyvera cryocrescens]
MQRTVFSPELQLAAERDGQVKQLASLQQYWLNYLAPDIRSAQSQLAVVNDLTGFVDRINQLVTVFDHTTEERIAHVVWMHRLMAVFMALLFIFTVFWLRTRLLHPWRQLLRMAEAISHRDFTYRAQISGRNEMATLGMALE